MTNSDRDLSMTDWPCATNRRDNIDIAKALIWDFDRVVFNHSIGQQLLAHAGDYRTSGRLIRSIEN
jgi:hypothetical protein